MSTDCPEWLQRLVEIAQVIHGEFSLTYQSEEDCWTIRMSGSPGSGYTEEVSRCKVSQLAAVGHALENIVTSTLGARFQMSRDAWGGWHDSFP
jgi:hypothetical protein